MALFFINFLPIDWQDFFEEERIHIFGKMYLANVRNRLRELEFPNDIDCKRWIWELVQNAKDSISNQPERNGVDIKVKVENDIYSFTHNGSPFTKKTLFALLYKYTEGKTNNGESTGRFGTGFLTTHSLSKIVKINGKTYSINLWDTIGQEKYRSLTKIFMKGAKIVIFVYDITNLESFNELNYWFESAKDIINEQTVMGIVGNKSDLFLKEEVKESDARQLAKEKGYEFALTSAKNATMFCEFLEKLIKKYQPHLDKIDLTYTQYITMMVLWEKKKCNVQELGKCLYLDSGTLTPLLKKLETKGYITRTRSKQDERNTIVEITNLGIELKQKAKSIPEEVKKCLKITDKEALTLYKVLYKILYNMEGDE